MRLLLQSLVALLIVASFVGAYLFATHVLRTLRAGAELRRRDEERRREAVRAEQRAAVRLMVADYEEDCRIEAYRAKASRVLGFLFTIAIGAAGAEVWVWA